MADSQLVYGSLCSGIGGLDLAVEAAWGPRPAWFCESDKHARTVLEREWPGVPVYSNIKTRHWGSVEKVDVLVAGYPCQPFSQAGKGLGDQDPRHLWPHVIRAARVLGPRIVVLENVRGHLRKGFDRVLGDLAEAGFDAEWAVVRASDAGACHRRERLFVVAYSRCERFGEHPGEPSAEEAGTDEGHVVDGDGAGWAAADPDSVVGAPGESFTRRPEAVDKPGAVERAIRFRGVEDAADTDCRRLEERGQPDSGTIEPGLEASRRGDADGRDAAAADTADCSGPFESQGVDATTLVGTVAGASGRTGERSTPAGVQDVGRSTGMAWGDYGPAIERWEHVIGRPAPLPTDDGRLAVPFVEWMQGFPEGWVDGLSRTAALRCLGNAVVWQQGLVALTMLSRARVLSMARERLRSKAA